MKCGMTSILCAYTSISVTPTMLLADIVDEYTKLRPYDFISILQEPFAEVTY